MPRWISFILAMGTMFYGLHLQAAISLPVGNGKSVELYSNSYALVIGVSDYKHWPDLPGVETDVDEIGLALESHGFTVINLLNPTRDSFDDAMREFIAEYGQDPNNRLVVYYAGHGHTLRTRRGRELGYIVPADAPLPKDGIGKFKARAISMLEVEIFAKQMEAKHAMFTFDSCFSGSLFEITRAIPDNISQKTAEPVRQFITAGSAEQTVPDKSVFRSQFIAGLDGEADLNKDGFITGTELAQFIEESVTNYTRRAQTPQYGKIRDPILDKGDFIFVSPKVEVTINQQAPAVTDPAAIELAYWNTIKDSGSVETYQAYLDEYPDGQFAKLAKILIKQAGKEEERALLLRKQRVEEEKRLAALRKAREQEFKRQQELLEKQRKENEKQLAAMRAQQEKLAAKGSSEAARLKKLLEEKNAQLEKQKALAKSNNVVASVKPASSLVSDRKISVAILTSVGTLVDDHLFERVMPNKRFSELMSVTVSDSIDRELKGNKSYVRKTGFDLINSIMYENDSYSASRQICSQDKADKVIAVQFQRINIAGQAEIHLFDCDSGKKITELVSLDTTFGEKYYMEKEFKKKLSDIYDDYPDFLR